ncbi:MAG TPA: hypothetical protein VGH73_09710 [Thermoanaerobaculia bacterium]|jgi:hypothetical protein
MIAGGDAARRAGLILVLTSLLATAVSAVSAPCLAADSATRLYLNGSRFQAEVVWTVPGLGSGVGQAVPLTDDTGTFWFFANDNAELMVKVLDGRAVNRHFWVFYGGLSDVEYTLTVTDLKTGLQDVFHNPAGRPASAADVAAFGEETPPVTPPGVTPPGILASAGPPLRLGAELQANVTTAGDQRSPAVAVGPDGGSAIAWLGPPGGLQIRFYGADGRPASGEIFPTATSVADLPPHIATDASGRTLVVWNGGGTVKGRVYGPGGQPETEEIAIGFNPVQPGGPEVVADPAGGFLVAWPEAADGTLRLQRFGPQGTLVGNEIRITRSGGSIRLAAFPAAGAGFVMAWTEIAGTQGTDVRALRLDALGRPATASSLLVNTGSTHHGGYNRGPVPVVHPDGGFSVVWTTFFTGNPGEVPGLFVHRYGADGNPAGDILQLSAGYGVWDGWPAAVALPTGRSLVLWYEAGRAEDPDGGTFGRLYDAFWHPLGGPFRINTYTQDFQVQPAVAVDAAGDLVTAWESELPAAVIPETPGPEPVSQDGDGAGVFAQRFTTATCALDPGQLCLHGRFRVAVGFTDPRSGRPGTALALPLTSDTGGFWFFDPGNAELIVKVLDGRAANGHFWVYAGALSDVDYTITVTDTATGKARSYHNERHQLASRADTAAF